MTMFINQMLGCLIIAAGIGGAVGWLLRNVSAGRLAQQLTDVAAMMHLKEQMLEKARHELREAASKLQALESQEMASQALSHSDQEKLSLRKRHIQPLKEEELRLLHARLAISENQCVDTDTQAVAQQIDKAA
jgi:hypothetical protein